MISVCFAKFNFSDLVFRGKATEGNISAMAQDIKGIILYDSGKNQGVGMMLHFPAVTITI